MKPSDVLPMIMPSGWTTVVFVAIVLAVCAAIVLGARASGGSLGHEPGRVARDTKLVVLAVGGYLSLTAVVSASGVLRGEELPPPMMLFFAGTNLFAVVLGLSKFGKRLALGVPLAGLVGFQAFRFPLELVLHQWFSEGVLPVQMTYAGSNFDIISGIGAITVGLWLWKGEPPIIVVWIFNIIGLGLLITVATIAVLSSPLPVRQFTEGPAVQLALHVPYGWIVPMCVGGALFGHVVTFRALLAKNG